MSYDLHLFRSSAGADLERSATASYEAVEDDMNPGPVNPKLEERKQRIAAALMAENPLLQPFVFDYSEIAQLEQTSTEEARRRWRHIELNGPDDDNGLQITLHDETASLTVPYWHRDGSAAAVWQENWQCLRVLEREGGFRTYDPQLERVLDLAADMGRVCEMYGQGVAFTGSVAGEGGAAPRRPWWKFW